MWKQLLIIRRDHTFQAKWVIGQLISNELIFLKISNYLFYNFIDFKHIVIILKSNSS